MIRLIIHKFIKNSEDIHNKKVRESYSVLSGTIGIFCNIFLFIIKFIAGLATNSVAVFTDAFNNLSDCASSVITIVSAKMSNRRPDKGHPFGHGRIEYISSLIVSFLIMIVGVELLKNSAEKIVHPNEVTLSLPMLVILLFAIGVKLWMFSYNRYIAKTIDSTVAAAAAQDSLNDSVATFVTVTAAVIGQFVPYPVDGIMGVLVSLFIIYGGFDLAKGTINILLGTPAKPETVQKITETLLGAPGILGTHDLIIHDYGPGRVMASVHAEVSDKANIIEVHEVIDELENKIMAEMGIHLVIHMDPITVDCEITNTLRRFVTDYLARQDKRLSFHDLRMTDGQNTINIIFDLVVPCEYTPEQTKEIIGALKFAIKELDPRYNVIINLDTAYIS